VLTVTFRPKCLQDLRGEWSVKGRRIGIGRGIEAWRAFSLNKRLPNLHRMALGNLGLICTCFPVWASFWGAERPSAMGRSISSLINQKNEVMIKFQSVRRDCHVGKFLADNCACPELPVRPHNIVVDVEHIEPPAVMLRSHSRTSWKLSFRSVAYAYCSCLSCYGSYS